MKQQKNLERIQVSLTKAELQVLDRAVIHGKTQGFRKSTRSGIISTLIKTKLSNPLQQVKDEMKVLAEQLLDLRDKRDKLEALELENE